MFRRYDWYFNYNYNEKFKYIIKFKGVKIEWLLLIVLIAQMIANVLLHAWSRFY